jgi:hypothetical protein
MHLRENPINTIYYGIQMVSIWYPYGIHRVSKAHYGINIINATIFFNFMVSKWYPYGIQMVSKWYPLCIHRVSKAYYGINII